MRDIVLIPTYDRPEMLWHCLEHLSAAFGIADYELRILVDQHLGPCAQLGDIAQVVNKFRQLTPRLSVREPHSYNGNSFNILEGYREALSARFVYLVEDDVLVEPDFFQWHKRQQVKEGIFCSIAVENERSGLLKSDKDYASLGVCFPRWALTQIVKHAKPEYYRDQAGYIGQHFNGNFPNEEFEQDGLILRVMGECGGYSVWPRLARARHIGFYGYHRPYARRPQGTLEERYHEVKQRIA